MIRVPVELFWGVVGDIYARIFKDRERRPMEALWQSMGDTAGDALARTREAIEARAIQTCRHDSHWGTIPIIVEDVTSKSAIKIVGADTDVWGRVRILFLLPEGAQAAPPQGTLWSVGDQVATYFMVEQIAGRLWRATSTGELEVEPGSSYAFTDTLPARFTHGGSLSMTPTAQGLVWDPGAIHWSILVDEQFHEPASGQVVALHQVETWMRPGLPAAFKLLALTLIGEDGGLEIRLEQEGDTLRVVASSLPMFKVDLVPTSGSIELLRDALEAATTGSPVQVELIVDVDMTQSVARARIRTPVFEGALSGIPWVANRYRVLHHVYNGWGDMRGRLVYQEIPEDTQHELSAGYGPLWSVTPPISSCAQIAYHPWRLSARASVRSRDVVSGTILVDAGKSDWFPDYVKATHASGVTTLRCVDAQGSMVTWEVVEGELPALGQLQYEPWYIEPTDYAFDGPGLLRAASLPSRQLWARAARAQDMDLAVRWGDMLGVAPQPDSQRYLWVLQGVYMALHGSPTRGNLEAAVGMMLGIGVARVGGQILGYELVAQDGSSSGYVDVVLDSQERVRAPSNLYARLLPVGSLVEPWSPVVSAIRVHDIFSNPGLIEQEVENVWARPHTFLVDIPDEVGLSYDLYQEIWSAVMRSRDPHTLPQILMRANSPSEDAREGASSELARGTTLSLGDAGSAHVYEDMIFDDGQMIVGEDASPNRFEQSTSPDVMSSMQMTSEGVVLGQSSSTAKLIHQRQRVGYQLGDAYPRESTLAKDWFWRPEARNLKESIRAWETATNLSRQPLRLQPSWTQKPTAVIRVLDGLGALTVYHASSWSALALPGGFTPYTAYTGDGLRWWIAGDNSTILRSDLYGASLVAETVPGGLTIRRIIEDGWAICRLPNTVLKRTAGVWAAVTMTGASGAHDYCGIDVTDGGQSICIGAESSVNPGDGVLLRSMDGGVTWSETISGGEILQEVLFDHLNRLWIARDGAICVSLDYGATWTDVTTSGGYWKVLSIKDGRLWCAGGAVTGGTRCGYVDLNTTSPVFVERNVNLGALEAVRVVASTDVDVSVVLSDGTVAVSRDAGQIWSDAGLVGVNDLAGWGWNMRISVGTGSGSYQRWI